jgi:hypothetical protein
MSIDELVIKQDRRNSLVDYSPIFNTNPSDWKQEAQAVAGPMFPATKDQVSKGRKSILDNIRIEYVNARNAYEALVERQKGKTYTFGDDTDSDVTIIRWREAEANYTNAIRQYIQEEKHG